MTAEELISAYKANEIGADEQYKNKVIMVSGTIDNIGKDILDSMYVSIRGEKEYEFVSVQAFFPDSSRARLAGLSKGNRITVICRCDGKFGNVLMKDCRF